MHDISYLTCFNFLRVSGFSEPVADRFSIVLHERGRPEILQDPCGIAVQLSTNERTCQLVGNNFPMFFIRNSIRFLDTAYSFMPKSHNHIQNNWRIVDFPSPHPDSFHMFKLLFDVVGCPQDYRDGDQRLVQGILPIRDLHCRDVFNDFSPVKPDGQHHLPELTNLAKLSFNAKVGVEE
ncbi:hypothetical protein Nepgr_028502 [Nepenthes gracilis]|uniref:catalase n=1 Tax=Nepenthes gracilis TaxID=150966 RepID=A0AAD3TD05_NEPGR|nr:hypothetical protein Nepgr_028502 [Nepenthes gracilis]